MKNLFFSLNMLTCLWQAVVVGAQTATLTEVQLYLESGRLHHDFSYNFTTGVQNLKISQLAWDADPASVKLHLPHELKLISSEIVRQALRNAPEPAVLKSRIDSLKDYNRRLEKLKMQNAVLVQEQELILANKQLGGAQGVSVTELQKMAEYYRQRLSQLNELIWKAGQEEAELQQMASGIKQRLNEARSKLAEFESFLLLEVEASKAGKYEIGFSYQSNSCGWEPEYDIHAKALDKPVEIEMQAMVYQHTGLDWQNVPIRLATVRPAQQAEKPHFTPWVLDFVTTNTVVRSPRFDGLMLEDAEISSMAKGSRQKAVSNFESRDAFLYTEYVPQQKLNLAHAGKRRMLLASHKLKADFGHFAAPRYQSDVLLMGYLSGWDTLRLIPGTAAIYFNQTLINRSWMNFSSNSDSLEIAFGVDPAVTVKLIEKLSFTENRRLGNNKEKHFSYEIQLSNLHKLDVQLQLSSQLPVSVQKEISVDVMERGGGQLNAETGELLWDLTLAPLSRKSLNYSFKVRYPGNKRVRNL
ncbi:MAG: mucoidy inhibitor MuiA family protein [Bacteroidia bacterium]